jgi:hypothetical protein
MLQPTDDKKVRFEEVSGNPASCYLMPRWSLLSETEQPQSHLSTGEAWARNFEKPRQLPPESKQRVIHTPWQVALLRVALHLRTQKDSEFSVERAEKLIRSRTTCNDHVDLNAINNG